MVTVKWRKCSGGVWCSLKRLNLKAVSDEGIYIIWHDGSPGRVVRLGQGVVADRLSEHRNNKQIMDYEKRGTLHVTWAAITAAQRDGVERYLADQWTPLVGDAFPDVQPIAVNSPW